MSVSAFPPEAQGQVQGLSRLLAQTVREYFKDGKHRSEFEEWYLERYGKPYHWEPVAAPEEGKT